MELSTILYIMRLRSIHTRLTCYYNLADDLFFNVERYVEWGVY